MRASERASLFFSLGTYLPIAIARLLLLPNLFSALRGMKKKATSAEEEKRRKWVCVPLSVSRHVGWWAGPTCWRHVSPDPGPLDKTPQRLRGWLRPSPVVSHFAAL